MSHYGEGIPIAPPIFGELSVTCDEPSPGSVAGHHIRDSRHPRRPPAMPDARRVPLDVAFWPLQIGGWSAFAVAMTFSRIGRFPLGYMVASKGLMALIGLGLTASLLRPLYRRVLARDLPILQLLIVVTVASYVVGVLWTAADGALDIPVERALLNPRAHLSSAWQLFGGTLYDAFIILAWSVFYVAIKHQQALVREQARALQAESTAHRAQLDALRWQLNPHFLFNSLNAISTLVVDGRRDDAAKMIARLADFLRTTISPEDTGFVSVAQEMEAVRSYLDIEKVRLGDRLRLAIDVTDDAWQARVPSLLLQPLVENAVRHAVAVHENGGEIRVVARRLDDRLQLIVDDDGPGVTDETRQTAGSRRIGLANTRARLVHGYGDAHTLELEQNDRGGARLRVELPFTVAGP